MRDRVEIRGLRVLGHHGAAPGERREAQPFEVDIDFSYAMNEAVRSDDLADAVDYGAVAEMASRVVVERTFALLETIADAIAEQVVSDPRVDEVRVTVRKLRPPVPVDVSSIGVTRVRSNSSSEERR